MIYLLAALAAILLLGHFVLAASYRRRMKDLSRLASHAAKLQAEREQAKAILNNVSPHNDETPLAVHINAAFSAPKARPAQATCLDCKARELQQQQQAAFSDIPFTETETVL